MGRFSQTIRYINPEKNVIYPHIYGITGLVNNGVCDLIVDLDEPLSGFLLWVMWLSSAGGYVVLGHDLK